MAGIGNREMLLLLVGLDTKGTAAGNISGITRLMKFLYLLQQEGGIRPTRAGYEFLPYKAGPYSSRLYDDLELLENLGLIRSEATAESTITESADITQLSFDELMGLNSDMDIADSNLPMPDSFEERRFMLTDEGKKRVEQLLRNPEYGPVVDGIRKVKSKYSQYSLRDLLRHVYRKYPEMTTESEIKDQVLGRRGR